MCECLIYTQCLLPNMFCFVSTSSPYSSLSQLPILGFYSFIHQCTHSFNYSPLGSWVHLKLKEGNTQTLLANSLSSFSQYSSFPSDTPTPEFQGGGHLYSQASSPPHLPLCLVPCFLIQRKHTPFHAIQNSISFSASFPDKSCPWTPLFRAHVQQHHTTHHLVCPSGGLLVSVPGVAGKEGVAGIAARALVCSASWELLSPLPTPTPLAWGPSTSLFPINTLKSSPSVFALPEALTGEAARVTRAQPQKTHIASGVRASSPPSASMTGTV